MSPSRFERSSLDGIYTAVSLEERSIRILDLEAFGPANADLRGRRREISIDESEPFLALSYV